MWEVPLNREGGRLVIVVYYFLGFISDQWLNFSRRVGRGEKHISFNFRKIFQSVDG